MDLLNYLSKGGFRPLLSRSSNFSPPTYPPDPMSALSRLSLHWASSNNDFPVSQDPSPSTSATPSRPTLNTQTSFDPVSLSLSSDGGVSVGSGSASTSTGIPASGPGYPPPSAGGDDIGTTGHQGGMSASSSFASQNASKTPMNERVELNPLEQHAKNVTEQAESLLERKRSTRSTRRRHGLLSCLGEESVDLSK